MNTNVRANIVIPVITNSTELKHEIMKLSYLKAEQELALRRDLKELYYSMQVSTLIKRTVKDLTEDDNIKTTAVEAGLNIGSGFILDKLLLRKGYGIKSYLLNMGLKKLVSYFTHNGKAQKLLARI